jgi:hypothetical protein
MMAEMHREQVQAWIDAEPQREAHKRLMAMRAARMDELHHRTVLEMISAQRKAQCQRNYMAVSIESVVMFAGSAMLLALIMWF